MWFFKFFQCFANSITQNERWDSVLFFPSSGSVLDQSLDSLSHRLRGLCDNMEPESFLDHEMVFLLKGQQASPFVLRARRSIDRTGSPWHLRYLGQPEMGDKNRHALVRNCVDIATSENLTDFLMEMGFRMDHEYVAKGQLFRKGIMKIMVYKIFRILVPGNTDSIEPLSLSYLVELSVVAPAGQDIVSDDMRNFAEQLKPLVHLEKIDPKRLMWLRQSFPHWGLSSPVTKKMML